MHKLARQLVDLLWVQTHEFCGREQGAGVGTEDGQQVYWTMQRASQGGEFEGASQERTGPCGGRVRRSAHRPSFSRWHAGTGGIRNLVKARRHVGGSGLWDGLRSACLASSGRQRSRRPFRCAYMLSSGAFLAHVWNRPQLYRPNAAPATRRRRCARQTGSRSTAQNQSPKL